MANYRAVPQRKEHRVAVTSWQPLIGHSPYAKPCPLTLLRLRDIRLEPLPVYILDFCPSQCLCHLLHTLVALPRLGLPSVYQDDGSMPIYFFKKHQHGAFSQRDPRLSGGRCRAPLFKLREATPVIR